MIQRVKGFCPAFDDEYVMEIAYIDASELSGKGTLYVKGTSECERRKRHNGDGCSQCTIHADAPNELIIP